VWWTAHGYVVGNCDLRGAGPGPTVCVRLWSDQESGRKTSTNLIEWAGFSRDVEHRARSGMIRGVLLAISAVRKGPLRWRPPQSESDRPVGGVHRDVYRGDVARRAVSGEIGFLKIGGRGPDGRTSEITAWARRIRKRPAA